tara:strand:+ start:2030 stop:3301 length:1272 start_codon:yes stop_codon:yes gene_type:complete
MGANKYKIIKSLGEGSYGSVHLAKNLISQKSNDYVAIKKFYMNDKNSFNSFKNEVKILKKIKSDYLVKIIDYYKDSQYMYLVMEYAPMGDLEEYIRRVFKENKKIDFKFIDIVIYQITEGLNTLHQNNIIHRDIKLPNILMFNENLIKITDFGVSKLLENGNKLAKTAIGTPYYMSPEVVKGTPYDFSVDFWALGCLIYKALTNKYPFEASNLRQLCKKIIKGKYDLTIIPFKYQNIVTKLLEIGKNRANEKDLFQFILSNSNNFIKKEKILEPIKNKISTLTRKKSYSYNNTSVRLEPLKKKDYYKPLVNKEILPKKLDPIKECKINKPLKEIEEINKKLAPISKLYHEKLRILEGNNKDKKLEPIRNEKIYKKMKNNYDYIDQKYLPDVKKYKLKPIKSNNKKDFVKFNIDNIKNIYKVRR